MTSSNQKKELIEIKIDSEEAIDNFGFETFEENILLFVDEGYNNYKNRIKKAQEERDQASLKILTHTLKTTSRYMASENFAQICQGIESEAKYTNWEKIDELLKDFFYYFDHLYNECVKFYNDFKPEGEKKSRIPLISDSSNSNGIQRSNNIGTNNENNIDFKNNDNNNNNSQNEKDLQACKFSSGKLESNNSFSSEEKIGNDNYYNILGINLINISSNNGNSNNYKHSNFKSRKTTLEADDENNNDYKTEINKKIPKNKYSYDSLQVANQGNGDEKVIILTRSSNKNSSFSDTFLDQRNNVIYNDPKSGESSENNLLDNNIYNLNIKTTVCNNNNLVPIGFNQLQTNKTIGVSDRNFYYASAESKTIMEINNTPLPVNSRVDKYSKILNNDSIAYKESDLILGENKGSISTPKYSCSTYHIPTSKTTDLSG